MAWPRRPPEEPWEPGGAGSVGAVQMRPRWARGGLGARECRRGYTGTEYWLALRTRLEEGRQHDEPGRVRPRPHRRRRAGCATRNAGRRSCGHPLACHSLEFRDAHDRETTRHIVRHDPAVSSPIAGRNSVSRCDISPFVRPRPKIWAWASTHSLMRLRCSCGDSLPCTPTIPTTSRSGDHEDDGGGVVVGVDRRRSARTRHSGLLSYGFVVRLRTVSR